MLVRPRLCHHWLLLCCLLAVTCGTPFAVARVANLSGSYEGHAPAADAAQRVFTLNLATDGSATLTTLFVSKGRVSQRGRWAQSGNQIVLSFDAMGSNRPPRPITFRHRSHKLSPVHWDPSEWGSVGPPVLYRAHRQAGS